MLKKISLVALLAMSSSSFAGGVWVDGGVSSRDLDVEDFSVRQNMITGSVGYEFEFVSLKASVGLPVQKELAVNQTDTYVAANALSGPILSTPYQTTIESSGAFGAGIESKYQFTKSWFLVGELMYVSTGFDLQGFSSFDDHVPSSNPAKDVLTNECFATGIESLCGQQITPFSSHVDLSGIETALGVEWKVGPSISVALKYRSLSDSGVKLNGAQLQFRSYF